MGSWSEKYDWKEASPPAAPKPAEPATPAPAPAQEAAGGSWGEMYGWTAPASSEPALTIAPDPPPSGPLPPAKAPETERKGWKDLYLSALKATPRWLQPIPLPVKELEEGDQEALLTKIATAPIPRPAKKMFQVMGESFRGLEDLSEAGVSPSAATVMRPVSAMVEAETPEARSAAKSKADLDALFD